MAYFWAKRTAQTGMRKKEDTVVCHDDAISPLVVVLKVQSKQWSLGNSSQLRPSGVRLSLKLSIT